MLVAEVGQLRVAFPLTVVREVLRMSDFADLPGAPSPVVGVLDLRGTLVPVLDLRRRLGQLERRPELDHRLVAVHLATGIVLLWVDEVSGLWSLEAEVLAGRLGSSLYVAGVARSDDGLLLVHDVDAFFDHEETAVLELALTAQVEA